MVDAQNPDLPELFRPRSVAVLGASRRPGTVGSSLFLNLLKANFTGVVYPVNPSWPSVGGVRCYPKLSDLPEVPDLALVAVPAKAVPSSVEELGKMGTRGVVVISSGFKEVGGDGVELERRVTEVSQRYKMTLVGPNCFGVINTDPEVQLNATFSDTLPTPGNIAFVSQSGALGAGILHYAKTQRIGFTKFVSVGNRAGVDELDLLHAFARDPKTRVILLYIESLARGRRFLEVAREVTREKPVLCIKSGRTPRGAAAALSHTGSLARAQSDKLYDGIFLQSRVLRADSLAELFQMAKLFATAPDSGGPRLAILTNSGGPGILAADAAPRSGLTLSTLPETRQQRLRAMFSPNAAVRNPVDMTADASPETYGNALGELLQDPDVDQVLAIATPVGTVTAGEIVASFLRAYRTTQKPTVGCLFGLEDISDAVRVLEDGGIPNFTFPEEGVRALGRWAQWQSWKRRGVSSGRSFPADQAKAQGILEAARRDGRVSLADFEAREVLACYGFQTPRGGIAHDEEEAKRIAEDVGYPVAVKIASRDILHKTDVGGVRLGLGSALEVSAAVADIRQCVKERVPTARVQGYQVERMVEGGRELILGLHRDPEFGPVVVFGMGGIYVEVLQDVSFRVVPLSTISAEHMVEEIQGYRLLQGVRGEPPADLAAVQEALLRLSQLGSDLPLVQEMDINPLIALPQGKGTLAVDCRIGLAPATPPTN
jgi:acetate---CoA ligase (ADP-forming)